MFALSPNTWIHGFHHGRVTTKNSFGTVDNLAGKKVDLGQTIFGKGASPTGKKTKVPDEVRKFGVSALVKLEKDFVKSVRVKANVIFLG